MFCFPSSVFGKKKVGLALFLCGVYVYFPSEVNKWICNFGEASNFFYHCVQITYNCLIQTGGLWGSFLQAVSEHEGPSLEKNSTLSMETF